MKQEKQTVVEEKKVLDQNLIDVGKKNVEVQSDLDDAIAKEEASSTKDEGVLSKLKATFSEVKEIDMLTEKNQKEAPKVTPAEAAKDPPKPTESPTT